MIARTLTAYVLTGLAFALIDSVWLRTMYSRLYQPELGEILGGLRLGPAIAFYLLYIAGMIWFAVGPARWPMAAGKPPLCKAPCWAACAMRPMILPIFATLKIWSLKVTLLDILWGTMLTGSASVAGWAATQAVFGRA